MPTIGSGKWYAQATFELALEKKDLESWQKGLEKIAELTTNEEFLGVMENPKVPFETKKKVLKELLGEINPLALNLAFLLASKDGLRLAAAVAEHYRFLMEAHQGIERARITTAVPLADKDKEVISRRLGEMVNRKVSLDTRVDPSVIGGLVVRIGDTLIDGSVRQNLETLQKSLLGGGRV
jgi:F-type H+-transporting ATPase subunit delta